MIAASIFISLTLFSLWVAWRFNIDLKTASAKAALGGVLIATRCGPIEYQEAGTSTPLLMVPLAVNVW